MVVWTAADRMIVLLEEQAQYHVNLVRGAEEEVLSLVDGLRAIRSVMDDAENRRFRDKNINTWLLKLEHTTNELDYVLDEWSYDIRKHHISPPNQKVWPFIPSSSCLLFKKKVLHDDIAMKLLNVKQQLDAILIEKDRYGFVIFQPTVEPSPKYLEHQTFPFIDPARVYGRDSERDILVTKLVDRCVGKEEYLGIRVVSIVGMGFTGKTILAKLVYNHNRVEEHFPLRIWIHVSGYFDLATIAIDILESMNRSSPNSYQLESLLEKVQESIYGKRFLLVLDDVRILDYREWELLIYSLRCGSADSTVLVTTRNIGVATMMSSSDSEIYNLELLSDEDCWLLLCQVAFPGRKDIDVRFEEIGKKIAKKCNGFPLAAMTLGRLLYFKNSLEEWENVLNSEIWTVKDAQVHIFPHLLLTYNELSPTLKLCFSYCAIFPKNSKIVVENLIGNWMALGYLGSDDGNMELKGQECFNVLAMHSLFQDFEKDDFDEIISCKMDDIVHDFAKFLKTSSRVEAAGCGTCDPLQVSDVHAFSTLYWDKETPPNFCECLRRLRVLSLVNCGLQCIPQGMEHFNHLRNLNLTGITKISHEDLKIIFQFYDLQTLCLRKCSLEMIPMEIENLVHLQRLDLSWNEGLKKLPSEIGNLVFLRHLHLVGNKSLVELPYRICFLQRLQTLNILGCTRIRKLPEGLASLTGLRTLGEFRGGRDCNKFGLLKNLNNLGGALWLRIRLGARWHMKDVWAAELSNKIHIGEFRIYFEEPSSSSSSASSSSSTSSTTSGTADVILDFLRPHSNLRELSIWNYGGYQLPTSMLSSRVRNLSLHFCKELTSLPPLGSLPCLEDLCIDLMEQLTTVEREFLGITTGGSRYVIAFPKLKKLEFRDCGEWKEWEDITAEEESAPAISVMPYLTELTITGCNGLAVLPHRLLRKASSLDKLRISGSMKLVRRYENKDGSDWKSISINNHGLRLICYS